MYAARMDLGHIPRKLLVCMYIGWKQASVQLEDKSCNGQTLSSRT